MLFAPQSSWKHTPFMLDSCLVKLRVYRLQYWPKISPLLEAGERGKKLGQTKLKSTYTIPISNWSKMFWSFVSSLSVKMETLHLLDNHVTSFIHDHISLIRPIWSLRTMETQIIAAVKLSVRGLKRELLVYLNTDNNKPVKLVTDYLLFITDRFSFLFISRQRLSQCSIQADIA